MAKPNPFDGAQEIQQMLVSYAKQETLDPLKALANYLKWGVIGALSIFIGSFFMALGVLRLMQSLEPFAGSSWASALPYVITMAVLLLFLVLIFSGLTRSKKRVL